MISSKSQLLVISLSMGSYAIHIQIDISWHINRRLYVALGSPGKDLPQEKFKGSDIEHDTDGGQSNYDACSSAMNGAKGLHNGIRVTYARNSVIYPYAG